MRLLQITVGRTDSLVSPGGRLDTGRFVLSSVRMLLE